MIRRYQHWTRSVVFLVCLLAAGAAWAAWQESQPTAPQPEFARLVSEFSEPGGYFDTDNLVSNERSYLHVMPQLERSGVRGGVYIGVGPDQNFSYIARTRPSVAFLVDIRRNNLLLHLLFKALFASSRNRLEFLCLLTGRPVPADLERWRNAGIDELVAYVDAAEPSGTPELRRRLRETIRRFAVPLSAEDLATMDRFHLAFVDAGLSLQFRSFGRPPRSYYPTYRELLLETDRTGRKLNYLSSEDDFQFLRSLQTRDRVIPVVGDLAGTHAVAAIGSWMRQHNERLSAFYVSNVENYLFRDGSFDQYMKNLNGLPHSDRSVVIRSIFGAAPLPESVPGYYSTSAIQTIDALVANCGTSRCRGYFDILKK